MKTAILVLCHQPPLHLATWAINQPNIQFYIHYDLKCNINELNFLKNFHNIHILPNRISVHWGGFSMILATLNLIQASLANPQHQYFHLISGNCIPLKNMENLEKEWQQYPQKTLFLECKHEPRLRYRVRFNTPHADTIWQRHLIGKGLTKFFQLLDKILPSQQVCWTGSQWFSADRWALEAIFQESLGEMVDFFEKKLVPDEHFFQYIMQLPSMKYIHFIQENHRFIRFSQQINHPDDLTLDDLWSAQRQGFWFARKVSSHNAKRFLEYEYNI